ncbi:dUTP diphosphatase (plasmid) [Raoultella ornithinolytica]|uniref:dUTP diphosphatase n=1 Tax=Raoultella ornithinolytica TaxID=54291 RepID=UPI00292B3C75|nr:dUTP diphosphatase [Raoultella ornithinolytica]MDV1095017.1 dUTP diphosphatase [Raoultella ornithinolytica]MDV1124013.1 dUTP diphosphatase [Raoultella ornithinolytica]MDV1894293.1 dUTP diphosphatase [Raoultella ornithinolytica]
MIDVKVKRLHPDAKLPFYATPGSAAMDFSGVAIFQDTDVHYQHGAAAGHTVVHEGECHVVKPAWWVHTGLAMEIPPGWCLKLYPRSGMGCKHHTRLANCVGIIDSDYRGEIKARLIADPHAAYVDIKPGMAVMQGMFERVEQAQLVEVDELSDTSRGTGGFGSTS